MIFNLLINRGKNMRTTQFIGLNKRALAWLEENCIKDSYELYCNGELERKYNKVRESEGIYKYYGMYDDEGILLKGFELNNISGDNIFEKVQCEPWSSGPVIFTYLVNMIGNEIIPESIWNDDEINEYL